LPEVSESYYRWDGEEDKFGDRKHSESLWKILWTSHFCYKTRVQDLTYPEVGDIKCCVQSINERFPRSRESAGSDLLHDEYMEAEK